MNSVVRTLEAVYENGLLRPLEPIQDRDDQVYVVMILNPSVLRHRQHRAPTPNLRGRYRGYLSMSDEFAANKQAEKALERSFDAS